MLTRLLSCSLLALLLLQPAHATPQETRPFKVCWSIYAGWMLWGYMAEEGIIDKWANINPAIKYTKSCCVGDTWMPEIRTDSFRV